MSTHLGSGQGSTATILELIVNMFDTQANVHTLYLKDSDFSPNIFRYSRFQNSNKRDIYFFHSHFCLFCFWKLS